MRSWRVSLLCIVPLFLATDAARADWPMPRANVQRTGFGGGTFDVRTPAVRWRRYLGGDAPWMSFLAAHVGGDDVVYLAASDRLEARRTDSTLLWRTPLDGVRTVLGREDIDGDGDVEIVAVSAFSGRAHVFDAVTGTRLWSSPEGRYVPAIWGMRLADLTGDGLPDLFLSAQSYGSLVPGSWADLYSFAPGAASPAVIFSIDQSTRDYDRGGTEAFADLDGDGRKELVAQGSRLLYAYSTVDGALAASGDVSWIPWATAATAVADLDADGDDEVVLLTNSSYGAGKNTRHVLVADLASGGVLTVRWQRDVADNQLDRHAFNAESIADIDGDGRPEVVSAFFDHVAGTWTTRVWNGADGSQRAAFPGQFAGADDLDGDGKAEVLTRPDPSALGVTAWDVDGPAATLKWAIDGVQLLREPDPGKAGLQSLVDRSCRVDVERDGRKELLLSRWNGSSWSLVAIDGADASPTPKRTYPLPGGLTFGSVRVAELAGGPHVMASRSDGYMVALDRNLAPTNELHYQGGIVPGLAIGGWFTGWRGLGSAPMAGDLFGDGKDDVVIRDSRRALVGLDTFGASMSRPPALKWSVFDERWTPSLGDLDADGLYEVLTGDIGRVSARSGRTGEALWTAPVTGGDVGYTSAYDLDGDARAEVGFVTLDGSSGDQVYGFLGPGGGALWPQHARYAAAGGFGFFSIGDVTGDGGNDVVAQAGNYMLVIDSATGAISGETIGTITTAPLLWDLTGDGTLDVLSNGFSDYSKVWTVVGGTPLVYSALNYWPEISGFQYGAMVTCPDGLRYFFAHQNSAHVRVLDPSSHSVRFDAHLVGGRAYGSAAEVPAWIAPPYVGNLNAVLGSDGEPRVIGGSSDGHLYVLHGCAPGASGLVDWAWDFGTTVGEPIIADVDGDPDQEIVVAAMDGFLYAIDGEAVPGPPSLKLVQDGTETREVETFDSIELAWEAAPGASAYEVAVQDGLGEFVTSPEFIPAGSATRLALEGLHLELDLPYYAFVRSVGADGSRSFERVTEGFRRVDRTPPTLTLEAPITIGAAVDVAARAFVADRTGLAAVRLAIEDRAGAEVLVLTEQSVSGASGVVEVSLREVPEGDWILVATAVDVSGKSARVARTLLVGAISSDPLGAAASNGCGCEAADRRAPVCAWTAAVLVAWSLLIRRRLRRRA